MRPRLNMLCSYIFTCLISFNMPLFAEESKPQDKPQAAEQDIWQEVIFESADKFELSDSKVQSIFEEIRRTDPQKAQSLEKLRKEDPKKFLEVIWLEIGTALQSTPKSDPLTAPNTTKQSEWQEQLQRRYASFMEWFAKEFPADHAELLKVQDADTEKYVQRVMDLMAIYEPIQRAQKYNPPLAAVLKQDLDLQKKRDALLLQIRTAVSDEQPRLQKELETLVAARFDIIVQKKELLHESLRVRLEKLSQQLDQQALELENLKKNKAQSVEAHVKELLSRSEKMTW